MCKNMKYKKYLFVISFLILLFSINCISANDNATDILAVGDNGGDTLSADYNVEDTLSDYEY